MVRKKKYAFFGGSLNSVRIESCNGTEILLFIQIQLILWHSVVCLFKYSKFSARSRQALNLYVNWNFRPKNLRLFICLGMHSPWFINYQFSLQIKIRIQHSGNLPSKRKQTKVRSSSLYFWRIDWLFLVSCVCVGEKRRSKATPPRRRYAHYHRIDVTKRKAEANWKRKKYHSTWISNNRRLNKTAIKFKGIFCSSFELRQNLLQVYFYVPSQSAKNMLVHTSLDPSIYISSLRNAASNENLNYTVF